MKRITFSLIAACFVACLSGVAQTVADIGIDWNGTAGVPAKSGIGITETATNLLIYEGTENEVKFTVEKAGASDVRFRAGTRADNLTYAPYVEGVGYPYWEIQQKNTNYIELSLTENSAGKIISTAKANGASGASVSSVYVAALGAICFSDKAPFDENSVIGVAEMPLPIQGEGTTGVTVAAPAGCKAFRIYNQVWYELISSNPVTYAISEFGDMTMGEGKRCRMTYASATLASGGSSISYVDADGKVIVSEDYYDLTGKKVNKDSKGFVIVKSIFEDGSSISKKLFNKE